LSAKHSSNKHMNTSWKGTFYVFFLSCILLFSCHASIAADNGPQQNDSKTSADDKIYVYNPETGEWIWASEKDIAAEDETIRRTELISEYLDKSRDALANNKFNEARDYANKALAEEKNDDAKALLRKINLMEALYKREGQQVKLEEARKQAEMTARREEEKDIADKDSERITSYLEKARMYARQSLEEQKERERGIAQSDETEKTDEAEKDRLRQEEEKRRQAAEETRKQAEEEALMLAKAERISGYIESAGDSLEENNFDEARKYARQALTVDEGNTQTRLLLSRIDTAEKAYEAEKDRLRQEEEERRQAAEEARKQAEEEALMLAKAERIAGYIESAGDSLEENNFDKARKYARQALTIDGENAQARLLLSRIDTAEKAYEAEKEQTRQSEEERRQAAEETRKQAEKQALMLAKAERISGYIESAGDSLEENNFDAARKYARQALTVDEGNTQTRLLLSRIDTAEKTYEAEKEQTRQSEEERRQAAEETRKQAEKQALILAKAERISGYMESAGDSLEENNFDEARKYARQALTIDEGSAQTRLLLSRIDAAEKTYEAEKERTRQSEEERRQAAEEERRQAEEEALVLAKAEKIAGYMESAGDSLENNNFDAARKYTRQALTIDEGSAQPRFLLSRIDAAEKTYEAEKERLIQEEEKKRQEAEETRTKEEVSKEAQRKASRIARHIKTAENSLQRDNFDRARKYAKKALDIDADNRQTRVLLTQIDSAEKAHKKERRRQQLAEEERQKQEEEARRREQEQQLVVRRAEKIAGYLEKADENLENNRFERARSYARKALEIDEDNRGVRMMLSEIDKAEGAYHKEESAPRESAVKPAQKEKEIEAAQEAYQKDARIPPQIAKEPEKIPKETPKKAVPAVTAKTPEEAERIAKYLEKANDSIQKEKYHQARSYVKKALKEDANNYQAIEMLTDIDKAIDGRKSRRAQLKEEEEVRKKAEAWASEQIKKETARKKQSKRIQGYIEKSLRYLDEEKYVQARRYAYMAWKEIPHDKEVSKLIGDIYREEMYSTRRKEEAIRAEKIAGSLEKLSKKEDPLQKYDEGKTWTERISGIFKKKTYELNNIHEDRIYTIDECVDIAKRNSQRIVVADKQVKLAEMRVWENRRALFPTVAAKVERSFGKISTSNTRNRHYQGEKYYVNIKQNLFDGMGSWFAVRQSQANLKVIKLEQKRIENEIIEETKKSYYSLDKAQKGLEIHKLYKEKVNSLYEIMDKAYLQELVPRVEYLKVKGQNAQANFQYVSSNEDVDMAEMILFQAMNMDPEERIEIEEVETPEELLSIGLDNCYMLAMANRPDLMIKEKTIEFYELERKMKKAKSWPKIDYEGRVGMAIENYQPLDEAGDLLGDPNRKGRDFHPEWYAGIRGSIPIWGNTVEYNYVKETWAPTVSAFRGSESATSYFTVNLLDDLAYFTNLLEAKAGFERAKYEYLKAKKDASIEVKEVYFRYKKSALQIEVSRAQIEHQRMFVDVLEERRRYGEMDMGKLVEEYTKLAENEYGLLQGYADYYMSIASLNKAIGITDHFRIREENRHYRAWEAALAKEETAKEKTRKKKVRIKDPEKRHNKITLYLEKAQEQLDKDRFNRARKYAYRALGIEEDNAAARGMLATIDQEEGLYREGQQ